MSSNNGILFTFGLIFVLIATYSAIVTEEFTGSSTNYDIEATTDQLAQTEIEGIADGVEAGSTVAVFFASLFFWTFGAPIWINIVLLMMKAVFLIILYDKFRGI